MRRSTASRIFIALTIALFVAPSMIVSCVSAQETRTNQNGIDLNPFQTAITSMKFYDAENQSYIGEQPASEIYSSGNTLWTPRYGDGSVNYHYPQVQMYASEPFLVNSQGLNIFEGDDEQQTKYIVDPSSMVQTTTKDPATGKYIYLAKVNVAYDIIIKTKSNLPAPRYQFIPIDQLGGISASRTSWHANPLCGFTRMVHGFDIFSTGRGWGLDGMCAVSQWTYAPVQSTSGVLGAVWDWFQVLIDCGQEPTTQAIRNVGINFALEDFRNPTQAASNIANHYGNRNINVVTTLSTTAYPDMISYDYYRQYNNQTFEVKTASTQMGFYDAKLIPSMDDAGRVDEYVPQSDYFKLANVPVTQEAIKDIGSTLTTSDNAAGDNIGGVTLDMYYRYVDNSALDSYVTASGPTPTYTVGKPATLPVRTLVTSENFDSVLPKTVTVTLTDGLQPYTKQTTCSYEGKAQGLIRYGSCATGFDNGPIEKTWTDNFVYRVTTENTYITHRVVLTAIVKTTNEILYIPASGSPVNVKDFKDYGINYVGVFDPSIGDAGGSITTGGIPNLFAGMEDIIIWIVVAIAVVGVVIVVIAISVNAAKQNSFGQWGMSTAGYESNRSNFMGTIAAIKDMFKPKKKQ